MEKDVLAEIKIMMTKAKNTLGIARELHEDRHYDDAASRSYYAVFHALQAALLTRGLTPSRHSGVIGLFNREFIHAGLFPENFYDMIDRLFEDRHIGDYRYDRTLSAEQSENDVTDAETIIRAIQDYLEREMGVSPLE